MMIYNRSVSLIQYTFHSYVIHLSILTEQMSLRTLNKDYKVYHGVRSNKPTPTTQYPE